MTHVPWHPDEIDTADLEELHGIESVELLSVGIDIGTTTSQLLLSRMIARRGGGILSTVRATRRASEEELRASAEDRLSTMIDHGVTIYTERRVGERVDEGDRLARVLLRREGREGIEQRVRECFAVSAEPVEAPPLVARRIAAADESV